MSRPGNESRARAEARRAHLRDLMSRLERALAEAPGGDLAGWQATVRHVVDELADALGHHARETERTGGFFDEVLAAAPRLSHRVEQLRAEHARLGEGVDQLRAALGPEAVTADAATEARERGLSLLDALARHRQVGADLLHEAYWVDVSTGD